MKKLMVLALVACFALSVGACSKKSGGDNSSSEKSEGTKTEAAVKSETDKKSEPAKTGGSAAEKAETAKAAPLAAGADDMAALGTKFCDVVKNTDVDGLLSMMHPATVEFMKGMAAAFADKKKKTDPWEDMKASFKKSLSESKFETCEATGALESKCDAKVIESFKQFGLPTPDKCGTVKMNIKSAAGTPESTGAAAAGGNKSMLTDKLEVMHIDGKWYIAK